MLHYNVKIGANWNVNIKLRETMNLTIKTG